MTRLLALLLFVAARGAAAGTEKDSMALREGPGGFAGDPATIRADLTAAPPLAGLLLDPPPAAMRVLWLPIRYLAPIGSRLRRKARHVFMADARDGRREPKVIKRYTNRKLYDTVESRYVTLDEIAEMIKAGAEVKVVDNRTKDDLTAVTLAQIIFSLKRGWESIFDSGEDAVRRHRKRLTPHERRVAAAVKTYREHTHAHHAALRAKAERARRGRRVDTVSRKRVYRVPISPTRLSCRMRLIGAHLTNDRGEQQYGPCLHILAPEDGAGRAVAVPRCFLVEEWF